ncbi:MAG TPA: peptidase S41, partial [Microscillaceae bacterium]|nr:peptidase S41 [Microscillaceae bacterium]
NQQYVDKLSNKKIAYVHLRYMGTGALNQLKREIVTEVAYKDGLILDLRYNTGGNVHDEVIQLLSRKKYFQWKYRGGNLSKRANFSLGNKPVVLLVNAKSLSDAEVLANGFKELKLGKIVGTGTYRWIIYTAGNRLVDGSFYRLPSWGCYTLDGKNLEKTGVSPDIKVDKNFKDRLDGRYPQLNKAIKVVNQLNKQ